MYVEIHRLSGGHPQQMGANTIFEGGGLLNTSTAPTGMGGEIGERYRRVEIGDVNVSELVREHQRHVAEFSRDVGLRVKAGTLTEVAAETSILSKPFVARSRFVGLYVTAAILVMPAWGVIGSLGRPHSVPGLLPAMLCGLVILFALFRLLVLPEFRRVRWLGLAGLLALGMAIPLWSARMIGRHRLDHRNGVRAGNVTAPATADQR